MDCLLKRVSVAGDDHPADQVTRSGMLRLAWRSLAVVSKQQFEVRINAAQD
jgi:hypothetical protein